MRKKLKKVSLICLKMKSNNNLKKICFIIPFFGEWPKWFDFYLQSCSFNKDINWLFFTDCLIPENSPVNVTFKKFSFEEFDELASEKLNLKIKVKNFYKLCDFKPAYGIIFEDYLRDYDFWGYTDVDIIYGNIRKFITPDLLNNYDVLSAWNGLVLGHFSLFKNNQQINNLFKEGEFYKIVYKEDECMSFDERGQQIKKNIYKSTYLKGMTYIIRKLSFEGRIKAYFSNIVFDSHTKKLFKKFKFKFYKGDLVNLTGDEKYMYFHILDLKKMGCFSNPKFENSKDFFYINNYGIFYDKDVSFLKKIFINLIRHNLQTLLIIKKYFIRKIIIKNIGRVGDYLKINFPFVYKTLKTKIF